MLLANLRVRSRLALLIIIAAVCLALVIFIALLDSRQSILAERHSQLIQLVDSGHGLLTALHQQVESGSLTLQRAQQQAREIMHRMRFGDGEYYFVFNPAGVIQLHGGNPDLVGSDLSSRTTPDGIPVFRLMGEVATKGDNAADFFSYDFPRAGGTEPFPKESYVRAFAPWGWALGTGVYIDDIQAQFRADLLRMLALLLVSLALLFAVALPVARSITRPMEQIGAAMDRAAAGDLASRTGLKSKDELGVLSHRIDLMLAGFSDLVHHLASSSDQLHTAAEQLSASAAQSSEALARQSEETDQLSAAMNQMVATVQEVARTATETASAIDRVDHDAEDGNRDVNQTIEKIRQLAAEVEEAAQVIAELEQNTDAISQVLAEIQGISEQTNLLALNAAIEAARAGESGRGFAVVADEVRQLAQRTQKSTEEIHNMNSSLGSAAKRAVEVMERSRATAEESVQSAQHAGKELERIVQRMDEVRDMGVQVATATEEQSQVSDEMNGSLVSIAEVSEQSRDAAHTVAVNSEQLSRLAADLQQQISRYHTGGRIS